MYKVLLALFPPRSKTHRLDTIILVEAMETENQDFSRENQNTGEIHCTSDLVDVGSLIRVGQTSKNGTSKIKINFIKLHYSLNFVAMVSDENAGRCNERKKIVLPKTSKGSKNTKALLANCRTASNFTLLK